MDLTLLVLGDVVGRPGRDAIKQRLPAYRRERGVDCCIANAENIAGGAGITPETAEELLAAGVDVLTSGDHIWDKKEIVPYLERQPRLLRPFNFPDAAAGRGYVVAEAGPGAKVAVCSLLGRVFLNQPADNPFLAADRFLEAVKDQARVAVIDLHAEATSEKIALGWYVDGRASLVVGTHTHIPTADERIFPNGTAYITDLGMTGPYDSVLGRRVDRVLQRFVTSMPAVYDVADGDVRICGVLAVVDAGTGRAKQVERVCLRA
jgi:metallophosphoesterase (TIGR00282 family)